MSDQQDKQRSSASSADDNVLSAIPTGPRDTTLGGPVSHPAHHTSFPPITVPPPPESSTVQQPSASDEQLKLPPGGLVAMRKSGGFKFSTQAIVVYEDGRVSVTSSRHSSHVKGSAQPRLSNQRMLALRRTLSQARLAQVPPPAGRQGPDTFAYEFVVRDGRKLRTAEAFEGSIPDSLAPLIRELRQLMPTEEANDSTT